MGTPPDPPSGYPPQGAGPPPHPGQPGGYPPPGQTAQPTYPPPPSHPGAHLPPGQPQGPPPAAPYPPSSQPGYPPPGPGYGYPPPPSRRAFNPVYLIAILGALVLVVASFLTWISIDVPGFGSVSTSGMGTVSGTPALVDEIGDTDVKDGVISLIIGVIAAALAAVALFTGSRVLGIITIVAALAGLGLMVFELIDISGDASDFNRVFAPATASVGIGIYVGLAGAAVATIGAVAGVATSRKP